MNKLREINEYNTSDMRKYCKKTDLDELHKLKLYLDDLYYNTDISGLSDKII